QFTYTYTNNVKPDFFKAYPSRKGLTWAEKNELQKLARYRVVSNIVWQVSSIVLTNPLVLNSTNFHNHYNQQKAIPLPLLTGLNSEQIARFVESGAEIPGLELEVLPFRHYPHQSLAAHTIGYVMKFEKGENEDEDENEDEFSFNYFLPDFIGKTGIESGYDDRLRGKAGGKSLLVNNIGYSQKEDVWLEPEAGKNVSLTIDLDLQRATERILQSSGEDTRGAAVVMDVNSGDVLAMASVPNFDLNMFVNRSAYTREDWERIMDKDLAPQFNRATRGAYPPGSIFKIVVAMAAIEEGLLKPQEELFTPGYYMLGKRKIKDFSPIPGNFNFKEAFKHSINHYFIEFGLRLGPNKIIELGNKFNLNDGRPGYFPAIDAGPLRLKKDGTKWQDGDTANLSIGQGEIAVTPLQMAVMTSAVANGGKVFKPRLVSRIDDQETSSVEELPQGVVVSQLNARPETFNIIKAAMLADVEEPGGTGKGAFVPGMGICGKTGTAQLMVNGKMDYITWFVSFAPFHSPRYAVVVMIESGRTGGADCAPKAREIFKAIQKLEARDYKETLNNVALN
ncbi:MAG: peptidoglycan D,D-transpeptidase FtsI family protein, partial [Verrucomicrobiales bacterium]